MQPFSTENEIIMRRYYESLNEKDRRRYAGIEALKLGHGGQNYIAGVLGCSRRTVRKGAIEVSGLPSKIVNEKIGKSPDEHPKIREAGGGSNSSSHYLFKQDLQILADEIGIEIRIAHYPPYCSKYNPIEHRLFPHITRTCQGVIFSSLEVVSDLIAKTRTKTGLEVFVHVINKIYKTGRKVTKNFKSEMRIAFDKILPKWNYRAIPVSC